MTGKAKESDRAGIRRISVVCQFSTGFAVLIPTAMPVASDRVPKDTLGHVAGGERRKGVRPGGTGRQFVKARGLLPCRLPLPSEA